MNGFMIKNTMAAVSSVVKVWRGSMLTQSIILRGKAMAAVMSARVAPDRPTTNPQASSIFVGRDDRYSKTINEMIATPTIKGAARAVGGVAFN
jgi:hypothetical protein